MAFVPDEAVYSSGEISHAAFKLFVCYCAHRNKSDPDFAGLSWPGRKRVHEETGINFTYISTLKNELADAGWIEIVGDKVRPLRGFGERPPQSNSSTIKAGLRLSSSTLKSNGSTGMSDHSIGELNSPTAIKEEPADKPLQEPAEEPEPASAGSSPEPVHCDLLFGAVAEACSIDVGVCTEQQRGALNQTVGILRKGGCTPGQVGAVREWWSKSDWRGRKGDIPTPSQLREIWGRVSLKGHSVDADRSGPASLTHRVKQRLITQPALAMNIVEVGRHPEEPDTISLGVVAKVTDSEFDTLRRVICEIEPDARKIEQMEICAEIR